MSVKAAVVAALMAGAAPTLPTAMQPMQQTAARTEALVAAMSRAWLQSEWQSYAARFVAPDGRVVDNGNGNISHSEGQGYGMLLAARAGDADRFDLLWRWTARTLLVRPDGLAAWRWDQAAGKVTDLNSATDGDILIAWALREGAKRFGRPDYRQAAEKIARAIGEHAVRPSATGPVLLPGAKGFGAGEQPDGPVINLSYWVFPAFGALKDLAPDTDWAAVRRSGLALLDGSRFGSLGLPTDWQSIAGAAPRPAASFPASFGYNAVRIPLYLAFDGGSDAKRALGRFAGTWTQTASASGLPIASDVPVAAPIGTPGYNLIFALARCATAGVPIPPEAISARSAFYYPETLRLLSVLAIQERFPSCL